MRNERLEFLGDRVLSLAMADLLLRRFPHEREGDLARRYSALVQAQTLAEIAQAIDLGQDMRLGDSEAQSGAVRPTILADALEAVLGAIFLDAGFAAAAACVERLWGERLSDTLAAPRDPKTALQEWAQARRLPLPDYREVGREGPAHAPVFVVDVSIKGTSPAAPVPAASARPNAWRRRRCSNGWDHHERPHTMNTPATRAGFVAIVGAPNAGKSTLVNALVGSKVSIVSPKVQTTRMRVIGIAMTDLPDGGRAQVVLVDTPGIFRVAKRRLERAMVAAAWQGAEDADVVGLMVDAERGIGQETRAIVERLKESRAPRFLILNKIDLVPREALLSLTADLNALLPFEHTFMVSALKQDGVADVLVACAERLPASPSSTPRTRPPTCRCACWRPR